MAVLYSRYSCTYIIVHRQAYMYILHALQAHLPPVGAIRPLPRPLSAGCPSPAPGKFRVPKPPPSLTLTLLFHRGHVFQGAAAQRGREEHRDLESQKADQAPRSRPWKWHIHDFPHHPYVPPSSTPDPRRGTWALTHHVQPPRTRSRAPPKCWPKNSYVAPQPACTPTAHSP